MELGHRARNCKADAKGSTSIFVDGYARAKARQPFVSLTL